jgi:hypothetical protein
MRAEIALIVVAAEDVRAEAAAVVAGVADAVDATVVEAAAAGTAEAVGVADLAVAGEGTRPFATDLHGFTRIRQKGTTQIVRSFFLVRSELPRLWVEKATLRLRSVQAFSRKKRARNGAPSGNV